MQQQVLVYEVLAVARPGHPRAGRVPGHDQLRARPGASGPSAVDEDGVVPGPCVGSAYPSKQRIFQSDAAALEETKRSDGLALAVRFAVSGDLAAGGWSPRPPRTERPGGGRRWPCRARTEAGGRGAAALHHHAAGDPGDGARTGVNLGRFSPAVHVTLWS